MATWHKSNLQWAAAMYALLVAAQLSPVAAETRKSKNRIEPRKKAFCRTSCWRKVLKKWLKPARHLALRAFFYGRFP